MKNLKGISKNSSIIALIILMSLPILVPSLLSQIFSSNLQINFIKDNSIDKITGISDVRTPSIPQTSAYGVIGNFPALFPGDTYSGDQVKDVFVNGTTAYLATYSGLVCVDISDPTNPTFLGNYSTDGLSSYYSGAASIMEANNTVFLAANYGGLASFDVSNPATPVLLSHNNDGGAMEEWQNVFIKPDNCSIAYMYAYISSSLAYYETMDISNPSNIQTIGKNSSNQDIPDSYVIGDLAYLANVGNGLAIWNVSNPKNMSKVVPSFSVGAAALGGIIVANNIAYITTAMKGIDIVDVSSPLAPANLSFIPAPTNGPIQGWFNNIAMEGNLLFAVGYYNLIGSIFQEYDISDPANPVSIMNCTLTFGNGVNIVVQNGLAYVANNQGGLDIVRYQTTIPTPTINPILPNPNPSGAIEVNWSAIPDADNYTLYRATHPITVIDGSVTNVTTTTGIEVTDTLNIGGLYYYAVMATNQTGSSPLSLSVNVTVGMVAPYLSPILPNPNTSGSISLNWNVILGADNYSIYSYNSFISALNSSVQWLGVATAPPFIDTNLPNGIYYYVVTANNVLGNSSLSNCQNITVSLPSEGTPSQVPSAPILDAITPNPNPTGNISLSWSTVTGATKYALYRYTSLITSLNSSVAFLRTLTDNSLKDNELSNGIYYYVVIATNSVGNSSLSNCEQVTVAITNENNPLFTVAAYPEIICITIGFVAFLISVVQRRVQQKSE